MKYKSTCPPVQRTPLAKILSLAFAVALPLAALPAHADELSDLKALVQQLNQRMQDLEAKQAAAAAKPAAAAPAAAVASALTVDQNGAPIAPSTSAVSLYNDGNSTLHMYALLEATISNANHQTADGHHTMGFQTAWFSGNRLGFDGDHALAIGNDIGLPDLKVISKLETEFELPTGNMDTANVFFNRDAWMGFYAANLGKITLGRQNTLTRDFTQNWGDPYGTPDVTLKEGGYSNVNNFKQFIFYSGAPTGTRVNSGIEWKKRFGDHVVAGIAYAFGSGGVGGSGDVGNGGSVPGDFTKGTSEAVSVAFNSLDVGVGKINVNASYDRGNVADLIHQSDLIGGNFTIGPVRLNAGFVHYTAQQGVSNSAGTRTDNSWTTSVSYALNKLEFDLGYQEMKGDHAGFGGSGNTLNPFGNTSGVTAVADGNKKTLYGSIIFHVDRQVDVYFAADQFKVGGGWVVGDAQGNGNHFGGSNPFNSEVEAAIGARYKF